MEIVVIRNFSSGGRKRVAVGILQYLLAHPDAKDSLKGIREQWIVEIGSRSPSEDVQAVLDCLVARGWLVERRPPAAIYSLKKDKTAQILGFLKQ